MVKMEKIQSKKRTQKNNISKQNYENVTSNLTGPF